MNHRARYENLLFDKMGRVFAHEAPQKIIVIFQAVHRDDGSTVYAGASASLPRPDLIA